MKRGYGRGEAILAKACKEGDLEGCSQHAELLDDSDPRKFTELTRACGGGGGDEHACWEISNNKSLAIPR